VPLFFNQSKLGEIDMAFDGGISAVDASWTKAEAAFNSVDPNASVAEYSKALLNAQMQIGIASNAEQKTSAAIDKAHQAHSQVASK
jgi:hypothetical protein